MIHLGSSEAGRVTPVAWKGVSQTEAGGAGACPIHHTAGCRSEGCGRRGTSGGNTRRTEVSGCHTYPGPPGPRRTSILFLTELPKQAGSRVSK